jgi:type IV pilus assembly protein PilC
MPIYSYVSLNEKGRKIGGTMTAANEVDLEERLQVIGLDLVSNKVIKEKKVSMFDKITLQDLIIFCIHIEQLEGAGVPILESIADIRDTSESPSIKSMMAEVYESIRGGKMLSSAMAEHPKVFNNVFVALVSAGEKSGNLSEVFNHLGKHLKWVNHIQGKIKKAVYYPIFLLALMCGIIALMMLFVIPKLSGFLTAQNFELPFYTKALIATSDFFKNYWYLVFSAPFVITFGVKILARTSDNFAYNIDNLKIKIPYIGQTIKKIEMARFCHFFAIMYKSGIGILDCLDVASNVINNKVIRENVGVVKKSISEGNSLTESLRMSNQFPNLVIRMFKVGEESGNLDVTLENINFFYDREVEDSVSNMVGIIQPALTIIMGGIMMWVSIAVFGPLYNSFSKMNF